MAKKILDELPVDLAQVKRIISDRKKDGELTYEQKKTLAYAKEFCKLDEKEAEEMLNELLEVGIDRVVGIKIVDMLPKNRQEVKVLFSKQMPVVESDIKKILGIVERYGKG